ncbi:hypothetical protein AC1031_010961 [Aphanomyces cochlioides]|nr:hypothetical protein AC1031_010910 [Aphanomyces cochlioides]KAG9400043.1 hypothetical protein AC1031_010961 [Aphanomyces cochlioides]
MLVDEATSDRLQNFPIVWPEEQYLTPFHFILTGSAGIAKFVAERHLERQVWDLPLFDLQETANLALRLQDALNIPTEVIEGAFGLNLDDDEQKKEKIGEYLDGLFGGVPGYVTELFLALSRKNVSLTSYMTALKSTLLRRLSMPRKRKHDFGWIKCIAPTIHGCTLEKLVCVA